MNQPYKQPMFWPLIVWRLLLAVPEYVTKVAFVGVVAMRWGPATAKSAWRGSS